MDLIVRRLETGEHQCFFVLCVCVFHIHTHSLLPRSLTPSHLCASVKLAAHSV